MGNNIFKIKFTTEIPRKKNLVFDLNSEKILSNILKDDFNILPTRLEKISLIVLLYSLVINFKRYFKIKKIYFNYLKSYIKLSNPEYLITFIDNDKRFYELKNILIILNSLQYKMVIDF